jgi:capsular exopolysaccharide synthesis family protein
MRKNKKASNIVFDAEKLLLSEKSPFSVQEAYKTLRTNITFSLPGTGCKSIGVVSANRGEGKSSVAVNLAIALAQINKKVVVIDCDMRLPTVASKLGVESRPGLSNYLSGALDQIPLRYLADRGLYVIPSGNIPPDSTMLINSQIMADMVRELRASFDYIIFDFPPVNIVSDAVMMAKHIDGYLLIVRHDASQFQMITETLRQMQLVDAKVIGFVYNGKSESKKYYRKNKYYKNYKYYKYYKSYGA